MGWELNNLFFPYVNMDLCELGFVVWWFAKSHFKPML